MRVWIWEDIRKGLTSNWHSGGGAVVVAETPPRAKELLREAADGDPEELEDYLDPVDVILDLEDGYRERVIIFPDAGCC